MAVYFVFAYKKRLARAKQSMFCHFNIFLIEYMYSFICVNSEKRYQTD